MMLYVMVQYPFRQGEEKPNHVVPGRACTRSCFHHNYVNLPPAPAPPRYRHRYGYRYGYRREAKRGETRGGVTRTPPLPPSSEKPYGSIPHPAPSDLVLSWVSWSFLGTIDGTRTHPDSTHQITHFSVDSTPANLVWSVQIFISFHFTALPSPSPSWHPPPS